MLMKIKMNIALEPLFKNYKRKIYTCIYSSIEDWEVVLVFERTSNNADLKKLSNFVWTDKWFIYLPKCRVYFEVRTQLWTAVFFFFHISIRINCKRISEGLLYTESGAFIV
jgi:hypothetical protein